MKEFVDAQGVTQVQKIPTVTHIVNPRKYSYIIEDLRPFTTYTVNVTAVPNTNVYRPPAKITVTTQMAGKLIRLVLTDAKLNLANLDCNVFFY